MNNAVQKEAKLKELSLKVKICEDCSLCQNRNCSVFSKGNANAQVMLIGEAPGKQENEKGLPFVGKSGEQLDNLLNVSNESFSLLNSLTTVNPAYCSSAWLSTAPNLF